MTRTITQEQTHETLILARRAMAKSGLSKFHLKDEFGRICLRGAINRGMGVPAGSRAWRDPTTHEFALMSACEHAMGFSGPDPLDERDNDAATWNNLPQTTLEMVIARFDAAIAATTPSRLRMRPRLRPHTTRLHLPVHRAMTPGPSPERHPTPLG